MGNSPAYTESRSMSRSPITKLGTQTPVMVTAAKAASLSAFRRAAATTPAGMAMSTDTTVADSASWSDTGTRSSRSRATGSREKSDRPMSPCRSRPNHRAYCSCTGRSNPRLDRISCTCSAEASVPAIRSTGSPGTSRTSTNTMLATTPPIGTITATRRTTHPTPRCAPPYRETITNAPRKPGGTRRRGRRARAPDPYLLGSFSEAENHRLVARQSAAADGDSAWSGARARRPRLRVPPASRPGRNQGTSPREPHVPEVIEVRIPNLDAPQLLAVRLDVRQVADHDQRHVVHDHGLGLRVEPLPLLEARFLARLFHQLVVGGIAVHAHVRAGVSPRVVVLVGIRAKGAAAEKRDVPRRLLVPPARVHEVKLRRLLHVGDLEIDAGLGELRLHRLAEEVGDGLFGNGHVDRLAV